jgi:UDP-N-acetylglucosamine 2-epimerase (non-hydrolysing)
MKKAMVVFGTRPEAIKLAPVIQKLKMESSKVKVTVCVTSQHREMLNQVLDFFSIEPDHNLDIMTDGQNLFDVTLKALRGLGQVIEQEKPDLVLVQGDTTTSFAGSLAAFYLKVPVGHVEAGLRTYEKYNPFPEEKNRHLTSVLADYHFAPTEWAKANLLREGVSPDRIWVTGNTVIDALLSVVKSERLVVRKKILDKYFKEKWNLILPPAAARSKLILVTGHRRESFGEGLRNICSALEIIAKNNKDVLIVYPVHLNPNVRKAVFDILKPRKARQTNIFLLDPLEYEPFVYLMSKAYLILTDSGGIQEEAPALGKPVLVMRDNTERPEGVEAGTVRLVGTAKDRIIEETQMLLENKKSYEIMAKTKNPYGDGNAARRIVNLLLEIL